MLRIWLLVLRNPFHFTTKDLAEKFDVNVRTIYRDLVSLGNELMVPVYEDKARWAINEDYFSTPDPVHHFRSFDDIPGVPSHVEL